MFQSKPSQEIYRSGKDDREMMLDDGCNPAMQIPASRKVKIKGGNGGGAGDVQYRNTENVQEEALRLASDLSSSSHGYRWGNQRYDEGDSNRNMRSILEMMIPEDPYFAESSRRDLFINLVEIEHLQYALLGAEKQVELMDSLTLCTVEKGETIYSRGDESSEFFIVLGSKDRSYSTHNSGSSSESSRKPCIELLKTQHHSLTGRENYDARNESECIKNFIYQDQIFGHDRFVFNKLEGQFRDHTAIALERLEIARVYPDDFQKWIHFRLSIVNDQRSQLEEQARKLTEEYDKQLYSLENKLATIDEDYNLQIEFLESQLIAANDFTEADVIFDDDSRRQLEQLQLIEDREAEKVTRLENMLVSMLFSPPESEHAAELVQKRMEEEAMMVRHAEEEEKRRLIFSEEMNRVRIWQGVRERMVPTAESTIEGAILCDVNLFSRLSLLAERVKWYDQVPDSLRDRYNAMFDECFRILGMKNVANTGQSINTYSYDSRDVFNHKNGNMVDISTYNNVEEPTDMYQTFLEIPKKVPINCLPDYKVLEREIKNTFARLSCDSQFVKFLISRSIDDRIYKSLYTLISMLSILYDYFPGMISYGANLLLRHTEKEAFTISCLLMEQRNLRILFLVNPDCMVRYHREFDRHLRHHLPRVWNHFRSINYPTIDITLKWFQSCFLDSNPGVLSLCAIDMLTLGVTDTLMRVGLGIMAYLERHILLCRSSEIQNCFRAKTMALKTTDILTYAFSVHLERFDLVADEELLLILSPENLRDHYYDDDSDDDEESSFVTDLNDSNDNLIGTEETAKLKAEQELREQERWEKASRDFEAEVNRMHNVESERKQRRKASAYIDELLCEGHGFDEALRMVAEKYPIGNIDENKGKAIAFQTIENNNYEIRQVIAIQSIIRRYLAKIWYTKRLASLPRVCNIRIRGGQLYDQQNVPFLLISTSSLQQPGKCLSSCQSLPFDRSYQSSKFELNEEFLLNFDSIDALITITVMNAGSNKEVTKRCSNSNIGIDKVFTGQAMINTSHLVQNHENKNDDVELDLQMIRKALYPLYNMYGRKSHSLIQKGKTSGKKLAGYLSVALCRMSPLKAQCGWFFELSTTVFGIIDAARVWIVIYQDVMLIYNNKYTGKEGLHRVIPRSEIVGIRERSFEGLDVNPLIIEMGGLEIKIESENRSNVDETNNIGSNYPRFNEYDCYTRRTDDRESDIMEEMEVGNKLNIPHNAIHKKLVLGWGEDSKKLMGIWKQLLTTSSF